MKHVNVEIPLTEIARISRWYDKIKAGIISFDRKLILHLKTEDDSTMDPCCYYGKEKPCKGLEEE